MPEIIKFGTLYMGDVPIIIRPTPRQYDYRHTPDLSIRDTVPGKEIYWVVSPDGLWISKVPLLSCISWADLEALGFVDGKLIIVDGKVAICRLLRITETQNEWTTAFDAVEGPTSLWGPEGMGFWSEKHGDGWGTRIGGPYGIRNHDPIGRNIRSQEMGFRPVLDFVVHNRDISETMIGKTIVMRSGNSIASGTLREITDYDLILEYVNASTEPGDREFIRFYKYGHAAVSREALDIPRRNT